MPIRFRCAHCTQLMSVASRKAGHVVRCPKCKGELIVPTPPTPTPPERDAGSSDKPETLDVELEPVTGSPGIVLSYPVFVVAVIVMLLLLVGACLAGFFLGR
jgi:DNA-directed RNA polymerase subunit RPC12/RpoP